MRILLLTHTFNSLSQALFVRLTEIGHEVSVELEINDDVTCEAARLCRPDVIIAPFCKRAIPRAVFERYVCLVVHPGIKGDRGPSSLDWAIIDAETEWGITVLQANGEMDAGDIWASSAFSMRPAAKSSIYRNEVTDAAISAVVEALGKLEAGGFSPQPLDYANPGVRGRLRPAMTQGPRAIDWKHDPAGLILRKIRASDGSPGVLDNVLGLECYLYCASADYSLCGEPGEVLGMRGDSIGISARDGVVWISHMREKPGSSPTLKLPARLALGFRAERLTDHGGRHSDWGIDYSERNGIGYISFEFLNGAMSASQALRLREALRSAKKRDTRVIVLKGGRDFFSNGIHLNVIESAESQADESLRNINAMNDLVLEILSCDSRITVAAMQGNAAAGGVMVACACDFVWARSGVILNPHYKNMGNLYGSEYWTYILPKRAGENGASEVMGGRLPIGTKKAAEIGIVDEAFGSDAEEFSRLVQARAEALAIEPAYSAYIKAKRKKRAEDEARKPLELYREEEMERMTANFYGFDPSYHVARYNFVYKVAHSRTPLHLALHRRTAPGVA